MWTIGFGFSLLSFEEGMVAGGVVRRVHGGE